MIRSLLATVAVLATAACATTPNKSSETLLVDVRGFGDGVRWRKPAQAAARLPPAERDDFLDERAELDDELRVDDYEVLRMSLRGADGNLAEVRVEWTWHLDNKGIVHTTITGQDWERHGKRWILVDHRRVSGEPMPGIAEPVDEAPAEPDDSAPEPAADPAEAVQPREDSGAEAGTEAGLAAPPQAVARAAEAI